MEYQEDRRNADSWKVAPNDYKHRKIWAASIGQRPQGHDTIREREAETERERESTTIGNTNRCHVEMTDTLKYDKIQ